MTQAIESIELRRGLIYHVDRELVEMSNALPVEDRLVIFDAVRLDEPREMDHHCVRYKGKKVSHKWNLNGYVLRIREYPFYIIFQAQIRHAFCSYKELMDDGE